MKAPPCSHTSTGRAAPSQPGVKTLSVRQSSSQCAPWSRPSAPTSGSSRCGCAAPKRVASRVPRQRGAGCGGRRRSAPTGGAAYGMPRKAATRARAPAQSRLRAIFDRGHRRPRRVERRGIIRDPARALRRRRPRERARGIAGAGHRSPRAPHPRAARVRRRATRASRGRATRSGSERVAERARARGPARAASASACCCPTVPACTSPTSRPRRPGSCVVGHRAARRRRRDPPPARARREARALLSPASHREHDLRALVASLRAEGLPLEHHFLVQGELLDAAQLAARRRRRAGRRARAPRAPARRPTISSC